ncbi:unnamed protein product [Paramecium sonneborni]|uniref:EF-hand domain-containing protein n=1 Tax=Paramecium sonneborni TaxID=65129 RepID=A0A8S1M1B8_9CILI|nr:unnamed protein product [Paramecium sonneborni]
MQKSNQGQSSNKLNRFYLFSRNIGLDNSESSKMRAKYIIHDKESLYEEIQNLKQENNYLKLRLRQFQSQNQYFKREVQSILKEDCATPKNYTRIKQGFLDKITKLEVYIEQLQENNMKLQQQLQDQIQYINQLQSPLNQNNVEGLCMSLNEDNMRMSQLIQQLEQTVIQTQVLKFNQIQNNYSKMNIKYNAILNKYKQIKNLNAQLLLEIAELRKKDMFFIERPQQKDNKKIEEQLQLSYDQAMVDLRNERQKNKYLENQIQILQADHQEQINILEKKMADQKKQVETLQRGYEMEKLQRHQSKRTILIKNNGPQQQQPEEQGELQEERELQNKKFINVDKKDILAIARQVKLNLIGLKISLQQVEEYLLTDEILSQQQLKQNLSNRIFGLSTNEQIEMAAIYLADVENETETTTSARVRSIFKTLMENYQILTIDQLSNINQQIMKKKNEISDILIKKYPDTYTSGYITIDAYLEILNQIDIQLSKIEIDHFYALIQRQNKSSRIFLQQIHSPFDVSQGEEEDDLEEQQQNFNYVDGQQESVKMSHSEILVINKRRESELVNLIEEDMDNRQKSNQKKLQVDIEKLDEQNDVEQKQSQQLKLELSEEEQNPFQDVQYEESDMKMINSQELRKQSQSELQQF